MFIQSGIQQIVTADEIKIRLPDMFWGGYFCLFRQISVHSKMGTDPQFLLIDDSFCVNGERV
jgi:hypothetical protein